MSDESNVVEMPMIQMPERMLEASARISDAVNAARSTLPETFAEVVIEGTLRAHGISHAVVCPRCKRIGLAEMRGDDDTWAIEWGHADGSHVDLRVTEDDKLSADFGCGQCG